jgi:hypothetical protein
MLLDFGLQDFSFSLPHDCMDFILGMPKFASSGPAATSRRIPFKSTGCPETVKFLIESA